MDTWKNLVRNHLIHFYCAIRYSCFVEESTAAVNQICSDYNIDLDDDSETPGSQSRNDGFDLDDEIDLDDVVGMYRYYYFSLPFCFHYFLKQTKIATKSQMYWITIEAGENPKRISRNSM
jgi:hypothetical protein